MCLSEFFVYSEGVSKREQLQLDLTRRIMWASIVPHSKKRVKLEDLIPLPIDKVKKELKPNVSVEEFNRIAKLMKPILNPN